MCKDDISLHVLDGSASRNNQTWLEHDIWDAVPDKSREINVFIIESSM